MTGTGGARDMLQYDFFAGDAIEMNTAVYHKVRQCMG